MKKCYAILLVATLAPLGAACGGTKNSATGGSGGKSASAAAGTTAGSGGQTGPKTATGEGGQTMAMAGTGSTKTTTTGSGGTGAGGSKAPTGGTGGTTMTSLGDGGSGPVEPPVPTGDADFDACMAAVHPTCNAHEMNTAALMETPCASLTMIPIPLTDGSSYGPVTLKGGPYGGKCEWNQGGGTAFVNQVNPLEPVCLPTGIETFAQPASVNAEIENLRDADYSLYTIFRPACFKKGEKYPVITWANGTCGEIAGYAPLLSTLASYGFVIVASNSTWTAGTTSADGVYVQLHALDYAKSINEDPKSIFYQKLDMDKIGAAGHSQGAAATAMDDTDPRIKAVIFYNTGTSSKQPFLDISGEQDVSTTTPASLTSDVNAESQPGGWVYYHKILATGGNNTGHLVLMEQPERVIDWTVAWWKWQLKGDTEAKKMFVGDNCGLCGAGKDDFEYGHNSMLQ